MKYVVKCGDLYLSGLGTLGPERKHAFVFESHPIAYRWVRGHEPPRRVVRLVPRKPKPVEPERTLGQVAHEAMWPFAPPMLPHELRAPDWEHVAAAVVAEHERRKAGAK